MATAKSETATARPWGKEAVSDAVRIIVGTGRSKVIIARLNPPQLSEGETHANADLILAAVNQHDALVRVAECAKALLVDLHNTDAVAALESALAAIPAKG